MKGILSGQMKIRVLFLISLTTACLTCDATVLLPPITKEQAVEWADLFAQVKVTGIAGSSLDGADFRCTLL